MTDIIIKGSNNINPGILNTIKEVYEEKKDIRICSLYQHKDNVVGVYMNSLDSVLSIFNRPDRNIETNIHEDFYVYLFSLEEILYLIYNEGSFQMVNILLHESDIEILNDSLFYEIQNFVKENLPLLLGSFKIINYIEDDDEFDLKKINLIRNLINEMTQLYDIDVELEDEEIKTKNDEIKIKNQLNLIVQFLKEQDFKRISDKNMVKLNKLFVEYQKII